MISARRWGGWSAPPPGRFTLCKDPVPIVQEAVWAPGPVWTDAEYLAPTGIRSPDRPARRKSLYRLSYRGPLPAGVALPCADRRTGGQEVVTNRTGAFRPLSERKIKTRNGVFMHASCNSVSQQAGLCDRATACL